jgi:hypothetical protein
MDGPAGCSSRQGQPMDGPSNSTHRLLRIFFISDVNYSVCSLLHVFKLGPRSYNKIDELKKTVVRKRVNY